MADDVLTEALIRQKIREANELAASLEKLRDERNRKVSRLYNSGVSTQELAEALEWPESQVVDLLRSLGHRVLHSV